MDMDIVDHNIEEITFREKYFHKKKPVLIKGAIKHWDMLEKWTTAYLIETNGDHLVNVSSDSRPGATATKKSCTLKEYLSSYSELNTLTYTRCGLENSEPSGFLAEIPFPNPFIQKHEVAGFAYFCSHATHGTLPHCHEDAFNFLQTGTKHWVTYDASPDTNPLGLEALKEYFQKYPAGSHARDWFDQELPEIRNANIGVHECQQEAGDVVYIPEFTPYSTLLTYKVWL